MLMDGLTKLFGGVTRMKLLRMFLINETTLFSIDDIVPRIQVTKNTARREVGKLVLIGLIKKTGSAQNVRFGLNKKFQHIEALRALFLATATMSHDGLGKMIRTCGAVKLIVLSGVFTSAFHAGADVLIVGDRMREPAVDRVMKTTEGAIGRELRYVLMSSEEFKYRTSVYDRLVRDILEYPKVVVVDKIGIAP